MNVKSFRVSKAQDTNREGTPTGYELLGYADFDIEIGVIRDVRIKKDPEGKIFVLMPEHRDANGYLKRPFHATGELRAAMAAEVVAYLESLQSL